MAAIGGLGVGGREKKGDATSTIRRPRLTACPAFLFTCRGGGAGIGRDGGGAGQGRLRQAMACKRMAHGMGAGQGRAGQGREEGRDEQAWGRPVAVAGQRDIRLRRGKGRAGVGAARYGRRGPSWGAHALAGRAGVGAARYGRRGPSWGAHALAGRAGVGAARYGRRGGGRHGGAWCAEGRVRQVAGGRTTRRRHSADTPCLASCQQRSAGAPFQTLKFARRRAAFVGHGHKIDRHKGAHIDRLYVLCAPRARFRPDERQGSRHDRHSDGHKGRNGRRHHV